MRLVVKHVSNEELEAIPAAAEDLFIIGGKDALEKRQQVSGVRRKVENVNGHLHGVFPAFILRLLMFLNLHVAQADAEAAAKAATQATNATITAVSEEDEDFIVMDDIQVTAAPSSVGGAGDAALGSAHSSTGTLTNGLKRDLAEVHLAELNAGEAEEVEEVPAKKAREA